MISRNLLVGLFLASTVTAQRHVVVMSLDGFPADALLDTRLPIPTLRKLAAAGSMARRMTTVNPTVTWPNHTAMVTGVDASRHGLLVNGTIVPVGAGPAMKVNPWVPKERQVHAPTVYDVAHHAGLTTAQVNWVAIKSAPSITWEFPEVPSADGAIEREMFAKGLIKREEIAPSTTANIVWRDQRWTAAGVHIIREHKPNLLLFHLLSLDSTHHTYGPGTLAAFDAIAFLDGQVAQLVDAVRAAGLIERTTFLIVSDHGFGTYAKQIHATFALAHANLGDRVYAMAEGGCALVCVKGRSASDIQAAREAFDGVEGIAKVAGVGEFASLGLPLPTHDSQAPDLVLYAQSGYAFSQADGGALISSNAQPGGAHGYAASQAKMDAIFIASGAGIRQGVDLPRIRNVDVAPTIAKLLGLRLEAGIDGRSIDAILK